MSWYTRGTQPVRNVEALVLGGIEGFVDAVVKGKARPWLHAATRATAAATAMSKHRIVDRVRAHDRNRHFSDQAADVLNKLLDLPPQKALPRASESLTPTERKK